MFSLNIVDHVRLDSEHLDKNYTVHARAAERLARAAFGCRIAIVTLLAAATSIAIATLLLQSRGYAVASAIATTVALIAFTVYAVLGLEARLYAHRAFVHRLWIVSQRYRSLLAEVEEGIVDSQELRHRRDALIREVHSIYEFGFGADQDAHETVRLAPLADQRAA